MGMHLFPGKTGRVTCGFIPARDWIGNSPAFISQGAGSTSSSCKEECFGSGGKEPLLEVEPRYTRTEELPTLTRLTRSIW